MIVAGIQVRQISGLAGAEILSMAISAMLGLLKLAWCLVTGLFRYRAALQAEILILRCAVSRRNALFSAISIGSFSLVSMA